MDILAEKDGKTYIRATIGSSGPLACADSGVPFPCLIWDHEGRSTDGELRAIAKVLLDAGCRYAVCGGQDCEAWHDTVDMEFIRTHIEDSQDGLESAHVMTSWHDDESPNDVAFFFVLNTNFDDLHFTQYLVLHVGTGPAQSELDAAVRKYALGSLAL